MAIPPRIQLQRINETRNSRSEALRVLWSVVIRRCTFGKAKDLVLFHSYADQ